LYTYFIIFLFYSVIFKVQSLTIYFSEVLLLKSEMSKGFYIMLPWLFIFDVWLCGFGEPLSVHCEPI